MKLSSLTQHNSPAPGSSVSLAALGWPRLPPPLCSRGEAPTRRVRTAGRASETGGRARPSPGPSAETGPGRSSPPRLPPPLRYLSLFGPQLGVVDEETEQGRSELLFLAAARRRRRHPEPEASAPGAGRRHKPSGSGPGPSAGTGREHFRLPPSSPEAHGTTPEVLPGPAWASLHSAPSGGAGRRRLVLFCELSDRTEANFGVNLEVRPAT